MIKASQAHSKALWQSPEQANQSRKQNKADRRRHMEMVQVQNFFVHLPVFNEPTSRFQFLVYIWTAAENRLVHRLGA